jgi:molybdopterin molybdotransferase
MFMLSFEEALSQLLDAAIAVSETEVLATSAALGRVLAHDLTSAINVPAMRNTQMDGYAVRSAELASASEMAPMRLLVSQRIPAGQVPHALQAGTVARIFTGAMLPDEADAVVMQEHVVAQEGIASFSRMPQAGEWVRPVGEDIACGGLVLRAGQALSPQALGMAASIGEASLTVRRKLRVACFFTGDELAMPGEVAPEDLPLGSIYNSNRFVLRALLEKLGCEVMDLGVVRDKRADTIDALKKAADVADLIVTSGGMSVGEEDHVKPAVESVGTLSMWQVAIKPGKPLAFGEVRDPQRAWFIGLPGNPVSAFVTFVMLVRPFILKLQGAAQCEPRRIAMVADFDWSKPDKRREFLRARIGTQGELELFASQSSSVLTSTIWADGLVDNPAGQAIRRGDKVAFIPFTELL